MTAQFADHIGDANKIIPGEMWRNALISPCGQYRWWLKRQWGRGGLACWVMLNPSTADAARDDPTLLRIIGFSRRWGFGGLIVVNLYPFRSSSPAECRQWEDRTGLRDWYACMSRNDDLIDRATRDADLIVAAWGAGAWNPLRTECVIDVLRKSDRPLHCLGTTADGSPKHPLARGVHRVPDDQQPIIWSPGHG